MSHDASAMLPFAVSLDHACLRGAVIETVRNSARLADEEVGVDVGVMAADGRPSMRRTA